MKLSIQTRELLYLNSKVGVSINIWMCPVFTQNPMKQTHKRTLPQSGEMGEIWLDWPHVLGRVRWLPGLMRSVSRPTHSTLTPHCPHWPDWERRRGGEEERLYKDSHNLSVTLLCREGAALNACLTRTSLIIQTDWSVGIHCTALHCCHNCSAICRFQVDLSIRLSIMGKTQSAWIFV